MTRSKEPAIWRNPFGSPRRLKPYPIWHSPVLSTCCSQKHRAGKPDDLWEAKLQKNSKHLIHHGVSMILRLATANENHWEREGTTSVVPQRRRTSKRL